MISSLRYPSKPIIGLDTIVRGGYEKRALHLGGDRERRPDVVTCRTARNSMAGSSLSAVEGHVCHAAYVDADRRQDSPRADAADQSLVERAAIRQRTRPHELSDPLPRSPVRTAFRLPGSSIRIGL